MKIYTKTGDDGTTGLLYGGRVAKNDPAPTAYGDVDEAQAAIGVARAHTDPGSEVNEILAGIERDLWVLMAELATAPENQHKLTDGQSRVTPEMVDRLEPIIDEVQGRYEPPREFVVPGEEKVSAFLDLSRTVVRRAERSAIAVAESGSYTVKYLNRLSDLIFVVARWQEGGWRAAKDVS
jgi:cob(I)alamin adenosyltransferase